MPEDGLPPGAAGRADFLLELEDRLRTLDGPDAVRRAALAAIAGRLGAARAEWRGAGPGAPLLAEWSGPAPQIGEGPVLTVVEAGPDGGEAVVRIASRSIRGWSAEGAGLAREAAERACAAARRAEALARLRDGEARSRAQAEEVAAVYAGAPIGLCVLDRHGRYLRINDVLAAGNGLPPEAHLGRTMREVLPGLAPAVEPLLARALAGEELRGVEVTGTTPAASGRLRTWRESFLPLRDAAGRVAGVTISVEEVTEEKAAERRQAYLLRLEERLRAAREPREALTGACALLGQEIGASLVGLSRLEEDGEHIVIESEWRPGSGASTLGRHRLADYGPERAEAMARGQTVVIRDAATDPRIPDLAGYEAFGVRAAVEAPLLREGLLRGHLFACDDRPRDWSEDDLSLVRETADRAWQAAERAQAEARLRESEARFRQLAETIREVFYVVELDEGRMSYVSPAYEEVWGRPRAEVLADPRAFLAQVHPDDRGEVQAHRERLWSGEPVSSEYRLMRPDGTVRHIHDRAALVTDPATGRRRAFGLAADVTDRRLVEERLHLATEAAGIGIFDVDLRTGVIDWDARLRELWGVGPDTTITDEAFAGGLHPDDRPAMREAVARTLNPSGDGVYRAEYRLAPRAGKPPCWIAAAGRAHFVSGRAVRFIGTVQDVTARKAAEAALTESEERFRALANTVPALIFVTVPDQGNVYSNERYQAYTGLGGEELLGDGWRRAIHPDDLGRVAEAWAASNATGGDYAVEVRVRRHDGVYRWHLTRGIPVRDAAGRIAEWIGTGTDVEEIVEAREALAASQAAVERANAELEGRVAERTASLAEANARLAAEIERREAVQAALVQSQKLEAVGQLTSGIAHDFNNVIAAIAGGFSVIERRTEDPRLLEVARHGAKAAERGGALVKQLLAFARQQVLTPQPCDLAALLSEAEPLIARSLGPRVELVVDCPEGLPEVRVDPVQLEAALINLAVNARDAMAGSGRLRIAARPSPPGEDRPEALARTPAVALEVADTGHGMPAEVVARALDPFFTTKAPGRGTGLGLAMVHGFVHQSGGALRIQSREGEGTTVTLWLPEARHEAAEAPPAPELPAEPVRGDGRVVLLVDDDAEVRGVTAAQLQDLGYEVIEAGGAEEALARIAAPGCAVDAVLTDVAMPGLDGVDLAAELRRRRPGLPVLFMTGHADRDRLLGEVVVDKPFTLPTLAAALARRRAP